MSIQTVRLRLKTLQEAIPGIVKAYSQLPRTMLNSADMPLFMTFVRDSENDLSELGSDTILTTRSYMMWLIVKALAEGEEGEGEALVEPWIDTVTAYFSARPTLGALAGVLDSYIASDSGPKRMVWPGTNTAPTGVYWGAEFKLDVTEVVYRQYSNNE